MTASLPFTRPPHVLLIEPIVRRAFEEDLGGAGDITSECTIPAEARTEAQLVARRAGTVAGLITAECAFRLIDPALAFRALVPDGSIVTAGATLAVIAGPARALLTGERVALNFVQLMSGIATVTRHYADAIAGTRARIVDTRKTHPGLRAIEKYAVRVGGGGNHRFGLDSGVLIKDNHIAAAGSIGAAMDRARRLAPHTFRIEIECETRAQVAEAIAHGATSILLDNMPLDEMRRVRETVGDAVILEASGNVTLDTVRAIAETGVDLISVGALTHSVKAVDLSMRIQAT